MGRRTATNKVQQQIFDHVKDYYYHSGKKFNFTGDDAVFCTYLVQEYDAKKLTKDEVMDECNKRWRIRALKDEQLMFDMDVRQMTLNM